MFWGCVRRYYSSALRIRCLYASAQKRVRVITAPLVHLAGGVFACEMRSVSCPKGSRPEPGSRWKTRGTGSGYARRPRDQISRCLFGIKILSHLVVIVDSVVTAATTGCALACGEVYSQSLRTTVRTCFGDTVGTKPSHRMARLNPKKPLSIVTTLPTCINARRLVLLD